MSRLVPLTTSCFLILATPLLVHPTYWTSWWALSGALAILGCLDFVPVNVLGRFATNASLLRLSVRVQRRAMLLSLRRFLDGFDRALFSGNGCGERELADVQLYVQLHYRLADAWERRVPFLVSGHILLGFSLAGTAVPFVVNLAAGSCIPAYLAAGFVFILAITVADLVHVALSNEQIERITELYRQAQTEIRDKIVRAQALPPDPDRAPVLKALKGHDRLLDSFLQVSGFRGKFLGFVVDFGVLRTFLVTIFTVMIEALRIGPEDDPAGVCRFAEELRNLDEPASGAVETECVDGAMEAADGGERRRLFGCIRVLRGSQHVDLSTDNLVELLRGGRNRE
ncbi:hypothetical protein DFJ74DRAFT_763283 [Hyaloraphidium curvatum]|nr:hypothetical protein DFJ74DRAFT_763283 [Hyaloraphidium curvatum]